MSKNLFVMTISSRSISRVLSVFLFAVNFICFVPVSFQILVTGGGTFGDGLAILPITLSVHLFLIPAVISWVSKEENQVVLLVINTIGVLWACFWLYMAVMAMF
jgi:hypothetical protein